MTARLRTFAAFWYDFVIGDDWRGAVAVAAALWPPRCLRTRRGSTPGG